MSKLLGVEEVEITRSEKLLAVVLTVFLLIGGLWVYIEPLDRRIESVYVPENFGVTIQDGLAIKLHERAENRLQSLYARADERQEAMELKREAYRTSLDAGSPDESKKKAYQSAQSSLDSTNKKIRVTKRAEKLTAPAAKNAQRRIDRLKKAEEKRLEQRRHNREILTFFLRFAFVLLTMAAAYLLFNRMRRRQSRYIIVAWAGIGYASILALVMAGEYTGPYIDIGYASPLVLSIVGVIFTLLAIIALHRFLAKRTPHRRVRRHQCPFCGYPVSDSTHCEGCGRKVLADCSNCGNERRVGSQHCRSCGKA